MADDNIVDLHRARPATCTHTVPSECPDAPHLRGDNLRLPADLAPLGLDPSAWPFTEGSERVGRRTLRELRDRAESAAGAYRAAEMHHAAALSHATLARTESETLAKRLAELAGDEDPTPTRAADVASIRSVHPGLFNDQTCHAISAAAHGVCMVLESR